MNMSFLSKPSEDDGNVREGEQLTDTQIFNETVAMLDRIDKTIQATAPVQIRVTREEYHGFKAMEADGDEDWDGDSDGWHYCGSPRGFGSTIQDAIDELIDKLCERAGVDDLKYRWA